MAYINVDEVYILDNTGLQVDMATDIPFADAGFTDAQKAQARANIVAGGTNPNLLDNPFFTVNQRGFTTGVGTQYCVDRWIVAGSFTATVNADNSIGISKTSGTTGSFYQRISRLDDSTTYTFSFIDNDRTIYSRTAVPSSSFTSFEINGITVRLYIEQPSGQTYSQVAIYCAAAQSGSFTIKAAKLEKGTISTLANDVPPNYAEELSKCQYYFRRVSGDVYLCSGMAVSTTAVVFPFPFTMRANPTITMTGTISAVGSGGILAVSSVNSVGRASNAIQVRLTVSGATQYGAYLLTPSNGGYLDFTADL